MSVSGCGRSGSFASRFCHITADLSFFFFLLSGDDGCRAVPEVPSLRLPAALLPAAVRMGRGGGYFIPKQRNPSGRCCDPPPHRPAQHLPARTPGPAVSTAGAQPPPARSSGIGRLRAALPAFKTPRPRHSRHVRRPVVPAALRAAGGRRRPLRALGQNATLVGLEPTTFE